MNRFFFLLLLIAAAWADCPCNDKICPDGMGCDPELQHCVCVNDYDYSNEAVIELPVTVYDFLASNPDFENGEPEPVMVASTLAYDNNPWFTNVDERFSSWYESTPELNFELHTTIDLVRQDDGSYYYAGMEYFPADNQGFGNEGFEHNYHFTSKIAWSFDYKGGEYLNFVIDDGILVYIDRTLVINDPTLNYKKEWNVTLDDVASELGLKPGYTYSIHLFHMERHKWHSMLDIHTNMVLHPQTCKSMCAEDAQCANGLCHPFEKICHCQSGWAGDFCDEPVCLNKECGDNGYCSPYDGKCYCEKGWAGDKCQIRTCNYYGDFTDDDHSCENAKAQISPVLECVQELDNGGLRAFFGYLNRDCVEHTIAAGTYSNKFTPEPLNRDQPSQFMVGNGECFRLILIRMLNWFGP